MKNSKKYIYSFLLTIVAIFFFILKIKESLIDIFALTFFLVAGNLLILYDFSKLDKNLHQTIKNVNFFIFPLLLSFFIWQEYKCTYFIFSYMISFLIHITLTGITKKVRICCFIELFCAYFICMINEYVFLVRGFPLTLNDLYGISTAFSVSSQYTLVFNSKMLLSTFGFIVLVLFILKLMNEKKDKDFIKCKILYSVFSIICIMIIYLTIPLNSSMLFDTRKSQEVIGFKLFHLLYVKRMYIEKPNYYSEETAKEIFEMYEADESISDNYPNIIVIMNESFSDLSYIKGMTNSNDYISNFNELKKESKYGNLIVPTISGGTCNTEFEFLTGLSTAFLPIDSYTYSQYIHNAIQNTLPWELKNLNYKTIAIHPFWKDAWRRDYVYPNLGFDDFISLEDIMPNLSCANKFSFDTISIPDVDYSLRNLVSDKAAYKELINIFENTADKKKFIFMITIQNHGGYDKTDFNSETFENQFDNKELDQYLTLMKESDNSLKELIDYFRDIEEETVILFFGDHQPAIPGVIETNPENFDSLEEFQKTRTTPFLIWKNYDSKSENLSTVGSNFLSLLLKEELNLPLTTWDKIRKSFFSKYTALSHYGVLDYSNTWLPIAEDSQLWEYEIIQYNTLFDDK